MNGGVKIKSGAMKSLMLISFLGIMLLASVEPIEGQILNPLENQTKMSCIFDNQTEMLPVTMGNQTMMMPFITLPVTMGNQTTTMPFMMMPVLLENQTMTMPFIMKNQTMIMPFTIGNQTVIMPFTMGNQTVIMPFIMDNQTIMPDTTMSIQGSSGKSTVVEITQLEQINTSLQKGPVFLRIGAKWCSHCQSMKPILEKMVAEYTGNATIAIIDINQSPELKDFFGVGMIPDSCVIVSIENGNYVYMQENGTVTTDRSQARFVGINEISGPNEETFKKVLDRAILQRWKEKSK